MMRGSAATRRSLHLGQYAEPGQRHRPRCSFLLVHSAGEDAGRMKPIEFELEHTEPRNHPQRISQKSSKCPVDTGF
jgi:hypothetical protein